MYQPTAMSGTYLDPDLNKLYKNFMTVEGNSLAVQWWRFCAFAAKALGSIPGRGTRILWDMLRGQKKKQNYNIPNIWSSLVA